MISRSFIDVLFILLLGTIVMLTETVHIGAVDAELLRLGGGAVSDLREDTVEVVVIDEDVARHADRRWEDADALARELADAPHVLLVVAHEGVRHRRVMSVWSTLSEHGLDVHLGVDPSRDANQGR